MVDRLEEIANKKFGISSDMLLDILESSHSADGYILGALGEMIFKEYAESLGYEVLRIKEKPEGAFDSKSDDAKGDFYIRKKGNDKDEWYVVECKSVKSNSEARTSFGSKRGCVSALMKHSVGRKDHVKGIYDNGLSEYTKAKEAWPVPAEPAEYFDTLDDMITALAFVGIDIANIKSYPQAFKVAKDNKLNYGIKFPKFRWNKDNPGPCIPDLTGIWNSEAEIKAWLNKYTDDDFSKDAFWELRAPVRLIQTHMPSTRVDVLGVKSTGPLVTEFNLLCLDLFIRTGKHELVFVNSQDLNPQSKAPNHLQQNYTVDVLVAKDGFKRHKLLKPFYDNLDDCIAESKPKPRKIDLTQIDYRK